MRLFVTGATGVLGRSVVRLLYQGGHQVCALSRSSKNVKVLRRLYADPVRADLFDLASLRAAVYGCEAILHLATKIPPLRMFRFKSAWARNDAIRREGTRNLVDAALTVGVPTFVYPSVCLVYPDGGDAWIDAQGIRPIPHPMTITTLDAEASVGRFAALGGRGVSLRMGTFYGPTSVQSQEQLTFATWGLATVLGGEHTYHSSIWIEDAASAVVAALQHAPSGTYDIVDDEPLKSQQMRATLAQAVGRQSLRRIPTTILRWSVGVSAMELLSRSLRVSNHRFKETTGWAPKVPTARAGWQIIAEQSAGIWVRRTAKT